jgi:dihydrofolate reductase
MGSVVAVENVTLDGVMQAPGGAEEDLRGDFAHGGWARPYADRVLAEVMGRSMGKEGALLFGRRTYEQLHGFWSGQTDGNPYTAVLNRRQKYVVSSTLAEPLVWQNSTVLRGDPVAAVAALKTELTTDLVVLGSGKLVRALAAAHLVDVYLLSIHPLTLGTGIRLFAEGPTAYGTWQLQDAVPTTTGVIVATYHTAP